MTKKTYLLSFFTILTSLRSVRRLRKRYLSRFIYYLPELNPNTGTCFNYQFHTSYLLWQHIKIRWLWILYSNSFNNYLTSLLYVFYDAFYQLSFFIGFSETQFYTTLSLIATFTGICSSENNISVFFVNLSLFQDFSKVTHYKLMTSRESLHELMFIIFYFKFSFV